MRLTAKVVALEDASKYTDGKPRVTLRLEEADSMYREIKLAMTSLERVTLGMMMDVNIPSLRDVEAV